jgi:ABC-type transport system involved in Fe-S cluster assembly fused permease/ATPase subunit
MDNLLSSISSQTVLVVAAIVVSMLLLRLVFRVLNGSAGLILTIIAIVVGLQFLFGISPNQLWREIAHLPQDILRLVENARLPELGLLLQQNLPN